MEEDADTQQSLLESWLTIISYHHCIGYLVEFVSTNFSYVFVTIILPLLSDIPLFFCDQTSTWSDKAVTWVFL